MKYGLGLIVFVFSFFFLFYFTFGVHPRGLRDPNRPTARFNCLPIHVAQNGRSNGSVWVAAIGDALTREFGDALTRAHANTKMLVESIGCYVYFLPYFVGLQCIHSS
jgi:hypothetical protein